jgi:hypothetical protein
MPWWGWLLIVLGVILLVGLIIFIIVQATKPKSIPVPAPAVVVKPSSEPIRQKAETLVFPKESGVYETLVPKPSASTSGSLGSVLHQSLAPYPVVKLQ